MSTNYELRRPTRPCGECGKNKNEPDTLHIGKSSGGWVFSWHGYNADHQPENYAGTDVRFHLDTPSRWLVHLARETVNGARIVNEYNEGVSLADFMEMVFSLRAGDNASHSLLFPGDSSLIEGDDVTFHDFC